MVLVLKMSKKKKWRTVGEILAEQANNAEFQCRKAERDRRREVRMEQYRDQERPILEELIFKGFDAPSVFEAARNYAPLPDEMVEILLGGIEKTSDLKLLEVLIRGLGNVARPFDGRPLVRCYESSNDCNLQFAVLSTIALARPHSIDEWIEKIRQHPIHGKTLRELEKAYTKERRGRATATEPPEKRKATNTDLVESSMNFDLEHVKPFLHRVASLIKAGFGDSEVEEVASFAEQLEAGDEKEWTFATRSQGKPSEFRVRVVMSDVGAPDLHFFSPPVLAEKIDAELERFADENGK